MICRLQKLWKEEVAKVGLEKASLVQVIVRFQRTRLILSAIAGVIAMVAAFLGPVMNLSFPAADGASRARELSMS